MIGIEIFNGQVIVTLPKAVLVMTKQEFIEALRCGKAWRRHQSLAPRPTTNSADEPHRLPTAPCPSGKCRPPKATETTRLHGLVERV